MNAAILIVSLSFLVAGCANTATGVVPIGNDKYMMSRVKHMAWSGGAVKADLYREAAAYCAESGKALMPATSTSSDSGLASYASAEIQFSCK